METRLVKYLKDGDKLIGAVVGLPDGKIGVSICNETDTFNKQRAVGLAEQRARYGVDTNVPHRWIKHSKASYLFLPEVVTSEIAIMAQRLQRYYRIQTPNRPTLTQRLNLALTVFGL
jgi:hypothetical protein